MWRVGLAILLIAHGIGHSMAVVPLFLDTPDQWHSGSWLLDRRLGRRVTVPLGVGLALVILVGFLLAGLSLGQWGVPEDWWRGLSVGFGLLGLVWLFLFWHSLAELFNKLGAIVVNAGSVIGIVVADWPGESLLN